MFCCQIPFWQNRVLKKVALQAAYEGFSFFKVSYGQVDSA